MRKGHITGHGIDDLLVLVQNDIDDEIHAADRGGFLQILADGVPVQTAGAGQRRDHEPVVGLNGQRRGNAGEDLIRGQGTRDIAGDDRDPLAGSGQLMERC